MILDLNKLFQFVVAVSARYNIDESHSLGHSMRVFHFAEQIANVEVQQPNPSIGLQYNYIDGIQGPWVTNEPKQLLEKQRQIIHAAAILHDTCDKKYRTESEGLIEIGNVLKPMMSSEDIEVTIRIIERMSYSKVTKYGMPDMGEYQFAFHVVREADLLDAYDFDRSVIFHFEKNRKTIEESYKNAIDLFDTRVLKHMSDGLLLTNHAIRMHPEFSSKAIARMAHWKAIL